MDKQCVPRQIMKPTTTESRKRDRPKASWMGGIRLAKSEKSVVKGIERQ